MYRGMHARANLFMHEQMYAIKLMNAWMNIWTLINQHINKCINECTIARMHTQNITGCLN